MRCFRFLFLLATAAAGLTACDELPTTGPESLNKINLPISRSWIYESRVVTAGADTTTIFRNVTVTVAGYDSLAPNLRRLLRMQITTRQNDTLSRSTIWYRHDDSGLWEMAYQNSENVFAYPKVQDGGIALGNLFTPVLARSTNQTQQEAIATPSIIFRSEPRCIMKYPMKTREEWVAFEQPFRRTMRCLAETKIMVPAGEFTVFKIQGFGDAASAASFEMYDYFCEEGLIFRELHWRKVQAYSPNGQLLTDPVNIDETIVLVDIAG